MRILNRLFARVWNFGFGRRGDDRLREEMEGHIAMQAVENVRAGMTPTEARRQAVLKLGAVEAIREQYHEEEGLPLLEHLMHDFRYALRQLRKSPGFTLTAVLTLALGIGATTAIFTLVQQVMLQSLPVNRPDQLWRIGDQPHCCDWAGYSQDSDGEAGNWSLFSWEAYKLFRANTTGFQDLAGLQAGNMPLAVCHAGSSGPPDTANGQYVSGNFFQTLGVSAWRGRLLIDADDQEGAPPGRGDELPCLAGEVRLRSFGGGIHIPDQRPCIHDHRSGPARFHRGEDDELGPAGYLDAAGGRAIDVGENGAN